MLKISFKIKRGGGRQKEIKGEIEKRDYIREYDKEKKMEVEGRDDCCIGGGNSKIRKER
jgi:hypothetical protein